jgi:hypothetical protein
MLLAFTCLAILRAAASRLMHVLLMVVLVSLLAQRGVTKLHYTVGYLWLRSQNDTMFGTHCCLSVEGGSHLPTV